MAFATMRLVASRLSRSGACTTYIASLLNADSDELACTVHMDPSPWLMALSMGMTSWPPDLTHDHPVGVHAQAPAHEGGQVDLALALDVLLPGLQRHHVGVQVGVAVHAQLEVVLDGDDPFVGTDLVEQRPQQRRLPAVDRRRR